MTCPSTGWFEIKEVPGTKMADVTAKSAVEQVWLTRRCPCPQDFILDCGAEFVRAKFFNLIKMIMESRKSPA
jgi:hypothetical protein